MARLLALLLAFSPLTSAAVPSAVAPSTAPESQEQLDHLFDGRASSAPVAAGRPGPALSPADVKFLDDLARRNFRYFYEQTNAKTGLTADRAAADGAAPHQLNTTGVASVASTGFGLSALCTAAKRGYIGRDEAAARVKTTLSFLKDKAPQEHGFFYHFLNMDTGAREWKSEVSSIDTALLMAGVLTAKQCFADPEISALADALYARIDFPWMLNGSKNLLSMGWTPEKGFIPARWDTYSEHMILDLLAIGSPTHPIPASEWDAWRRPVVNAGGQTYVAGTSPLFIHQYSQAYVDFRGKCDAHGLNYFDNSVKATLAQREYMKDNGQAYGWSKNVWGLTASDTCTGSYAAWGAPPPEGPIDGTVVPSAPGGSLMFTPRESLDALSEMRARFPKIYGRYGFTDSFTPKTGCVNKDVLGIDQGITLLSAANLQGGDVWEAFMKNPEISGAMAKVGFGACH